MLKFSSSKLTHFLKTLRCIMAIMPIIQRVLHTCRGNSSFDHLQLETRQADHRARTCERSCGKKISQQQVQNRLPAWYDGKCSVRVYCHEISHHPTRQSPPIVKNILHDTAVVAHEHSTSVSTAACNISSKALNESSFLQIEALKDDSLQMNGRDRMSSSSMQPR